MRGLIVILAIVGLNAAAAPLHVTTSVRADPRTGRLVRSTRSGAQATVKVSTPPEVLQLIDEAARRHEVDPHLVESVMRVESNFDAHAVSSKGAMGLMQLIPATARRFGVSDAFDARQNIDGGVRYLKHLQSLYTDTRLVLAAYNAGEGAVARYRGIPPYSETVDYVQKVGLRYGQARRSAALQESVPETPAPLRISEHIDTEGRLHFELR